MEIKISKRFIPNPSSRAVGMMYLKMKKAVKRKLKSLDMPLSKYLKMTTKITGKKKETTMPFLFDFTKIGLGESVDGGNKIQFPTGITVFAFIYLVNKNMMRYSKNKGWYIVPYSKDSEKPANFFYLKWENYVKDMFPHVTDEELSLMYKGTVADSLKYRMIKQYTGGKGWCQTGQYPDQSNLTFVQCYDENKKCVFWEDLPVMIQISNIIRLKKKPASYSKKLKMPAAFKPIPPSKMTDKELYQYLLSRKKEYIPKVARLPAGGWKLQFLTRDVFKEALKRKFVKKDKKHGWVLIE